MWQEGHRPYFDQVAQDRKRWLAENPDSKDSFCHLMYVANGGQGDPYYYYPTIVLDRYIDRVNAFFGDDPIYPFNVIFDHKVERTIYKNDREYSGFEILSSLISIFGKRIRCHTSPNTAKAIRERLINKFKHQSYLVVGGTFVGSEKLRREWQ